MDIFFHPKNSLSSSHFCSSPFISSPFTSSLFTPSQRKLVYYHGNLTHFVEIHPEAKYYYELQSSTLVFKFPIPERLDGIASTTRRWPVVFAPLPASRHPPSAWPTHAAQADWPSHRARVAEETRTTTAERHPHRTNRRRHRVESSAQRVGDYSSPQTRGHPLRSRRRETRSDPRCLS